MHPSEACDMTMLGIVGVMPLAYADVDRLKQQNIK
jgi:hypothetical protein